MTLAYNVGSDEDYEREMASEQYEEIENMARIYIEANWDPEDPDTISEIMYDINVSRDEAQLIVDRMKELNA